MTKVELIVVIICVVIFAVYVVRVPLYRLRHGADGMKDQLMLVQIHKAMLTYANDFNGQLPLPSVRHLYPLEAGSNSEFDPFEIEQDYSLNTTAHLYSMMIMQGLIPAKNLISPAEVNAVVEEFKEFDYEAYRPVEGIYWDDRFRVEIDSRKGKGVCHTSYAHLALCGERIPHKWRESETGGTAILSTRGTENGIMRGPEFDLSPTLRFMGAKDEWQGNIVMADNHAVVNIGFWVDEIGYDPRLSDDETGPDLMQPDNIFAAEFDDYPGRGKQASGDAFLVICDAATRDSVHAIYDRLRE